MAREPLPRELARQVTPRALKSYAIALDWRLVDGLNGDVTVYHRPDSTAHQVIIPIDTSLDDYDQAVAETIRKFADYEHRPANAVLDDLLQPPADILKFREISSDAETGNLPFEHAVRMINGIRRLLLSVAHSVLDPKPYHPRLSLSEAEEFVNRCRLGQTERGSFVLSVACPLESRLSLPGVANKPFARRTTNLLMRSLDALARLDSSQPADELLDRSRNPGISANLLESILQLRPEGDRATLTVSATWSRTFPQESRQPVGSVQLAQDVFQRAEAIAQCLRTPPVPVPSLYPALVTALRGQPNLANPLPSGEVDFTVLEPEEGELSARGNLNSDDYAVAAAAHLATDLVVFKGTLRRLPRMSRVENISDFKRLDSNAGDAPAANKLPILRIPPGAARAPKRPMRTVESMTIILHGTLSQFHRWYVPGAPFHQFIQNNGFADVYQGDDYFRWRAAPTDLARRTAARELVSWVEEHPAKNLRIIAHSHGGNVANIATTLSPALSACALIYLAVPAMSAYLPDLGQITSGRVFTVRANHDIVVGSVAGAKPNYQSYPSIASHETDLICADRGHWAPIQPRNWIEHGIANRVTEVCCTVRTRSSIDPVFVSKKAIG